MKCESTKKRIPRSLSHMQSKNINMRKLQDEGGQMHFKRAVARFCKPKGTLFG